MVIAHTFGAGTGTDAFLIAFKIPNFMRRLFAEGAFAQAFVPVLSEYKTQRSKAAVKHLVDQIAGSLGSLLLIITLLGITIAPLLVLIFAPGFFYEPAKYELTIDLLKITFPYLFFIALTALAGSILNTYGNFAIPAVTPVLLNLCLISAALWLTAYFNQPIMALAWGVLGAGIVQFCFQLPFLYRLQLLPRPRFDWRDDGVRRIRYLMLPALFGVSITQINLLVDTLMASFLETGSVSWLYYSDRLMEFPVGVFGLALATVTLPNLSKSAAQNDMYTYTCTLDWALRWVFLVAVPAMIGLMMLAGPILTTLFFSGEFSQQDVERTTQSLIAYAVGLLGFVLIKLLASGFYARQDTRTPVRIAVIAMITNMILNITLIIPLQHAGLALATSFAALLNASLLYHQLHQQAVFKPQPGWSALLARILIASGLMMLLLWWGRGQLASWFTMNTFERALHLFAWITLAMSVYLISLIGLGLRMQHISLHQQD